MAGTLREGHPGLSLGVGSLSADVLSVLSLLAKSWSTSYLVRQLQLSLPLLF